MDTKAQNLSVAYCGLICGLCSQDGSCDCRGNNHCGKRLSPEGCYQYNCCREKGYAGCWDCPKAPCGMDMLAPSKVKMRAFVRAIHEDGMEAFAGYIQRNAESGLVYHRSGILGDYDLDDEEQVLTLLRTGKR